VGIPKKQESDKSRSPLRAVYSVFDFGLSVGIAPFLLPFGLTAPYRLDEQEAVLSIRGLILPERK
jgi:hypothetical protein